MSECRKTNSAENMAMQSVNNGSNSSGAQVKIADYILGETLGSGTFGKVKG